MMVAATTTTSTSTSTSAPAPAAEAKRAGKPVIDIKDLTTAFGDHVVHEHLDLQIFQGEILALVGG